jgi:hydrogenase/urease accessory protein HupE
MRVRRRAYSVGKKITCFAQMKIQSSTFTQFARNTLLKATKWVFLSLLECIGLVEMVCAHDPGLSSVAVKLEGSRMEAVATFARKDIEGLIESSAPTTRPAAEHDNLQELAREILTVENAGRRLTPVTIRARFDDRGNVEFSLNFVVEVSRSLQLRSCLIPRLPFGHRQFLSVTDESGRTVLERLLGKDAEAVTLLLQPDWRSEAAKDRAPVAGFLTLGMKHILTGYDHLLFLLALLVVTRHFVSSLKIITCFTLAHSITLAMATFNVVVFPSRLVEPLIAASIIYVGVENLVRQSQPNGRWLLTFGFGLVHGLGFASVLREMGLAESTGGVLVPLFSFNLGVELGQLMVAALVLALLWKLRSKPLLAARVAAACSAAVAGLGGYWLFERVALN